MKTNKQKMKHLKLKTLVGMASLVFIFTLSSCASKTQFLTSTVVPAAQGTVVIKKDKNKNYRITIEISNLSPSTRLTPPSNAYVVWLITSDNNTQNLGQLNSSDNFMSKNLDAQFETVTGLTPAKIVITAENDPHVKYPSFSEVILATDFLNLK
jgi:hypothetical protein